MPKCAQPEDFAAWRETARQLLAANTPPQQVQWNHHAQDSLFGAPLSRTDHTEGQGSAVRVPIAFMRLAEIVAYHRDPERWDLLYQALFRLRHGEPQLIDDVVDPLIHRLQRMEQAVRRDEHKMHAFVRFRCRERDGLAHYLAWHRPDHLIVRLAAPFFVRRFRSLQWTLMTPDETADWDGATLRFLPGVAQPPPGDDALDELWRTYYASIFNPARINLRATKREMPVRHWRTLPEARDIGRLIAEAPQRVEQMLRRGHIEQSAAVQVPPSATLPELRDAVQRCTACELCRDATQAVFGDGETSAQLMIIGEQPGDREDRSGRPFCGPAGLLLDELCAEAGVRRHAAYVTNAVKHFRHRLESGRRLHVTPAQQHVVACRPWLEAEIRAVRPSRILCLGNTAARALLGPQARVSELRGSALATEWAPALICSHHPSAILRAARPEVSARLRAELLQDLKLCAAATPQ